MLIDRKKFIDLLIERHRKNFLVYFPEGDETPFCAAAELRPEKVSGGLLIGRSFEYVYFASCDELTSDLWRTYTENAISAGFSQIQWGMKHRCTDISLIIAADDVSSDVRQLISSFEYKRKEKAGLWGWAALRVYVLECGSGKSLSNSAGKSLKRFLDLHIVPESVNQ